MGAGVLPPFTGLVLGELFFVQTNKIIPAILCVLPEFFVRYGRKRAGQNRWVFRFRRFDSALCLATLFESFLAGEVYTAAVVYLGDLDPSHVAYIQNILDLLGALELKIRCRQ